MLLVKERGCVSDIDVTHDLDTNDKMVVVWIDGVMVKRGVMVCYLLVVWRDGVVVMSGCVIGTESVCYWC